MTAACHCSHRLEQIFSVGNNCIPPCSIIRLGFGAYLHSFSVLLPPSSFSRNSRTFPEMLVMGSHPARPRRVRFSNTNPVLPYDEPVCFPLLTILLHTAGRAMAVACRCPHGQQQIFSVGNNCIPLYSIIHLGFGAYLYSFSVLLPPSSLSRNSVTFPKKLVTGSHPARLHRVRSSDANPVSPHDGPLCFPLLTILLHAAGRAMTAACRCSHR